jgi:hypothetical protein
MLFFLRGKTLSSKSNLDKRSALQFVGEAIKCAIGREIEDKFQPRANKPEAQQ